MQLFRYNPIGVEFIRSTAFVQTLSAQMLFAHVLFSIPSIIELLLVHI